MGYGLIAGLTLTETLRSAPGFVMDLFIQKRNYDDEQHGIKRRCAYEWSDS